MKFKVYQISVVVFLSLLSTQASYAQGHIKQYSESKGFVLHVGDRIIARGMTLYSDQDAEGLLQCGDFMLGVRFSALASAEIASLERLGLFATWSFPKDSVTRFWRYSEMNGTLSHFPIARGLESASSILKKRKI